MTLEVRVLAAEFASVMGVSFRDLAGNGHQALYGFHLKWEFKLTRKSLSSAIESLQAGFPSRTRRQHYMTGPGQVNHLFKMLDAVAQHQQQHYVERCMGHAVQFKFR